ncbi:MAG: glutaredoxin family protein [Solirubrobacteraceae bacterium]
MSEAQRRVRATTEPALRELTTTPREVTPPTPRELTLYSRAGCHLCERALASIERARERLPPFTLTVLDIASSERLHAAYFDRIPVVALDGEELAEYSVEEETLREALLADRRVRAGDAAGSQRDARDGAPPR